VGSPNPEAVTSSDLPMESVMWITVIELALILFLVLLIAWAMRSR